MELTESQIDKISGWRRQLHSIPEPGFEEVETSRMVSEILTSFGYKVESGIARTGIVASLGEGKTILIRAEMDGLPVKEQLSHSFVSKNEGMMHACGHDANMACVLGAAQLLSTIELPGCVRIFMQPSAEAISQEDNKSGSNKSIEQGVLKGVSALLSLHVDSTINCGSVGLLKNKVDNRIEEFAITLSSSPDNKLSLMAAGASVIKTMAKEVSGKQTYEKALEIDGLTSSHRDGKDASVIVTGRFESLGRDTFKFFDDLINATITAHQNSDCRIELSYESPDPQKYVDDSFVSIVSSVAEELLGKENVNRVSRKAWSDDFFPFSSRVSSALILLGVASGGARQILHTSSFDIDESSLGPGAVLLARSVVQFLQSE